MKKSKKPKKMFALDENGKLIVVDRPSWRDAVLKGLINQLKWTYHRFLTPRDMGLVLFAFAAMALVDPDSWREWLAGGIFVSALMALKSAVEWLREPERAP